MWRVLVVAALLVATEKVDGDKVVVLPHDVYPGYEVTLFNTKRPSNFRLMENNFSKFFTVLGNGLVMTTSDLSPLVDRPVNLMVVEELANATETHFLHLYVINRRNMITFSHDRLGEGEVGENRGAGTPVEGFPVLRARGSFPVHYAILADETGDRPFALREEDSNRTGFNLTLASEKEGVRVVTARPLDREASKAYTVVIHASDGYLLTSSRIDGVVRVLDENDNSPVFEREEYTFEARPSESSVVGRNSVALPGWKRFSTVGKVVAKDADGDRVAYKLVTPSRLLVVVPQTGELMLVGEPEVGMEEDGECVAVVEAHDVRNPSRTSERPAKVVVRFLTSDPMEESVEVHRIQKRRVTRAVRPTKKVDFTEADGDIEGKIVFYLEKENEKETYKIRDENKWVTVDSNGSVIVKQKWDYEELGSEKTIDFWVTITNTGKNISNISYIYFFIARSFSSFFFYFFYFYSSNRFERRVENYRFYILRLILLFCYSWQKNGAHDTRRISSVHTTVHNYDFIYIYVYILAIFFSLESSHFRLFAPRLVSFCKFQKEKRKKWG